MARPVRFQNTYRLESKNPFNKTEVENILAKVMNEHFSPLEKFSEASVNVCRWKFHSNISNKSDSNKINPSPRRNVSDDAMNLIKALRFER